MPASDIADNPYWKRDVRRAYPQLSMITQSELSSLLIQHSASQACVPISCNSKFIYLFFIRRVIAPSEGKDMPEVPATLNQNLDLTEAINAITSTAKVYSESKLPPSLPTPYKRWSPKLSPPPPHDEYSYFPMSLYR